MDVKIRHKLIEIEDRVSDSFFILITNYRWLRILEVIKTTCKQIRNNKKKNTYEYR